MSETKPAPATAKELTKIETQRQVCQIRYSPCGRFLCGGGYDGQLHRWDVSGDEAQPLPPVPGHHGWVQAIAFASTPDPPTLYAADSWGRLTAWDYAAETPAAIWSVETAHDGWIRDLAVSGDGRLLATAGRDRFVRIWNAADGKQLHQLPRQEHDLCRVAIHPGGRDVVSGDLMGSLKHWRLESGECVRQASFEKMHFYDRIQDVPGIYGLRFDDAQTMICAGGQPVRTGNHQGIPVLHQIDWETFEAQRTQTFGVANDGFVFDNVRHPDGYFALVTSGNPGAGQFILAEPDAEQAFLTETKMSNCHSLALHPDGGRLVVAATNRNSQGNGAVRDKEGNYIGNSSPLHVFQLTKTT